MTGIVRVCTAPNGVATAHRVRDAGELEWRPEPGHLVKVPVLDAWESAAGLLFIETTPETGAELNLASNAGEDLGAALLCLGVPVGGECDDDCDDLRRCRICGCTDTNCGRCVQWSGIPCMWSGMRDPDGRPLCGHCEQFVADGLSGVVHSVGRWSGDLDKLVTTCGVIVHDARGVRVADDDCQLCRTRLEQIGEDWPERVRPGPAADRMVELGVGQREAQPWPEDLLQREAVRAGAAVSAVLAPWSVEDRIDVVRLLNRSAEVIDDSARTIASEWGDDAVIEDGELTDEIRQLLTRLGGAS